MGTLKKLAGQTAVYGLSSMLGRLLNFLLVPLYTSVFAPSVYGIVTELYAYVVFFIVLLTYGMETTLFRFSKKYETKKDEVYSTSLISVAATSILFILFCLTFSETLAGWLDYDKHPEYVVWFALILGLDAITAIPFAKLREQHMAERFATYKLLGIVLNITLNLFFIVYCPYVMKGNGNSFRHFVETVYNPEIGVGYIFISNLISSAFSFLLLLPTMFSFKLTFDKELWRKMMPYAIPLLIAGMAGTINETLDRVILKQLVPDGKDPMYELGIYGAVYKLAMFMTLFIQAYRFASEPFFFANSDTQQSKPLFAKVMKFFVLVCSLIFLVIMLYIDIFKNFIDPKYHEGLPVVPVLLLANLFLGVFINLSVWYKLTDQTKYGSYLAIIGALITIALNCALVPFYSYTGAAWATLITYFTMMVISFHLGQKHYPIPYNTRKILLYILLSLGLYFINLAYQHYSKTPNLWVSTILLSIFLMVVFILERPKKMLN